MGGLKCHVEYLKKHFNQAVITYHSSILLHEITALDRLHNSLPELQWQERVVYYSQL